jgi:hypothetical protein
MKSLKIVLFIFLISSCAYDNVDEELNISILKNQNIHFRPSDDSSSFKNNSDEIILGSGRVILKKVILPSKNTYSHAEANIRLVSTGDPWDKSGSFFILPTSDLSFLKSQATNLKNLNGLDGQPPIELLRFITPFGVGYFNEKDHIKKLKPVYIDEWEDDISWNQDISQLLPVLEDEVWVGIYIDTWSDKGWEIDVNLKFKEPLFRKKNKKIVSLLNTTPVVSAQDGYDQFGKKPLTKTFELEKDTENVLLYYLTTGHGGHGTGDEFVKKTNIISLNNEVVKEFVPWRNDCASFRRFNPSSGVWTEKAEWKGKEIEERIASSDYSRSGWCPGSKVLPTVINLGDLKKGNHEVSIFIRDAQITTKEEFNFWNVSAYIAY